MYTRVCLVIYTIIWFIYAGIMTYDRGRRAGLISLPTGRPISTLPARPDPGPAKLKTKSAKLKTKSAKLRTTSAKLKTTSAKLKALFKFRLCKLELQL